MALKIEMFCDLCQIPVKMQLFASDQGFWPPRDWREMSAPDETGNMKDGIYCPECQRRLTAYFQHEKQELKNMRAKFVIEARKPGKAV